MKHAHTPGPWTVQFAIASNPVAVIYADKRGDVAVVHRSSPTQNWSGIETDEAKANATVIAAAPELLAALEHMVAVSNWATTIQSEEQYDAMIASAEAAIRKAKGE